MRMPVLEQLSIGYNNISTVSPFTKLFLLRLAGLNLDGNKINNEIGIHDFPALSFLSI